MKGGRLESNSFCASNMNAHALKKMNIPYSFVYGKGEKAMPELTKNLKALSAVKTLKNLRVGSFGGRVPGFYTSNFNELKAWEKFGTEIENVTLLELVKLAESMTEKDFANHLATVKGKCDTEEVSEDELNKASALYAAFLKLAEKYKLEAVAVRCWPEFGDLYGIAVCHVLSCLTENGLTAACEGDIYGAIAMKLAEKLTGSKAFFCDMISFDEDGNTGIFWHCGAAPSSLCGQNNCPALKKHSIVDGGGKKGISCEFPLKEGPVTVLRLGENEYGEFRLLSISAEALPTDQMLKGNPVKVRFESNAKEIAETLIEEGFEHHFALIHGDIEKELEIFAKLLDLELIQL
jgi:L-fucose isomerase-like protein